MTKLFKNGKIALAFVLAIAVFAASMFTGSIAIKSDACTTNTSGLNVVYVGSDMHSENTKNFYYNSTHAGTKEDPFIIETPGQWRWLAQKATYETTYGKYFKVADGIDVLCFQSESYVTTNFGGIDGLMSKTAEEVKEVLTTVTTNRTQLQTANSASGNFGGHIDGNGATFVGIYNANGGLFNTSYENVSFSNLTLSNCYFQNGDFTSAFVGRIYASSSYVGYTSDSIAYENVVVRDCYITSLSNVNRHRIGVLLGMEGLASGIKVKMNNCLIYDNVVLAQVDGSVGAVIGDVGNFGDGQGDDANSSGNFYNSIVLGVPIFNRNENKMCRPGNFKNYYTDIAKEDNSTTYTSYDKLNNNPVSTPFWPNWYSWSNFTGWNVITADSLLGYGATTACLNLDWAGTWIAATGENGTGVMPDLMKFHTISATNNGDGTHSAECTVCGIKSVKATSHSFVDRQCTVCGYAVAKEKGADYWNGVEADGYASGRGTEKDPYIIKTTGQLYHMVRTDGKASDGSAAYYKVDDSVKKFYVNDNYTTPSLEGVKEMASGTYYSWDANQNFYGIFDGNGATIYGLINKNSYCGFVQALYNTGVIKNINFDSCYVYSNRYAAMVTTAFNDDYKDETNLPTITNVSVRNSYIHAERYAKLTLNSTTNLYEHGVTAGGITVAGDTPKRLTVKNCLFDGNTCELTQANYTDGTLQIDATAGIVGNSNGSNNVAIRNCVSLGKPIMTQGVCDGYEIAYTRYAKDNPYQFKLYNCYSDTTLLVSDKYTLPQEVISITNKTVYTEDEFIHLDWANAWKLATVEAGTSNERTIPMPTVYQIKEFKTNYADFSKLLANYNGVGLKSGAHPSHRGTYGWNHKLVGSGTEKDPYIIDSAEKLAAAIATGGKNVNEKLYYKLACDINLGGLTWINHTVINTQYDYVAFEGVLDGDGHIISGLSAHDDVSTGLIPELNGGTIKNVNIRQSYAASAGAAGVIAGTVTGGTIENCSVETSTARGTTTDTKLIGSGTATIKNTYVIPHDGSAATYYDADGNVISDVAAILAQKDANGKNIWYMGNMSGENATPRLLKTAMSSTYADINGDGVADGYDANDAAALRNCLLKKADYANVYGDVSRNGVTNIADLVILRREMAGSYGDPKDGFWRNVELGNVAIYYAENDTQDMARKMQLYLEAACPGVNIIKYAGDAVTDTTVANKGNYVANTPNAIVITKTFSETNYDKYTVAYDKNNNVLTIDGGSFTAVEQAVLNFVEKSDIQENTVYTGSGSILDLTDVDGETYKKAVKVAGQTYYYAWGDEFESDATTSYSTNNWQIKPYKTEPKADSSGNSMDITVSNAESTGHGGNFYINLENPNAEALDDLWVVDGGKLTIWRGINKDVATSTQISDAAWGYKAVSAGKAGTESNDFDCRIDSDDIYVDAGQITTEKSMLFKQGYAEMRASLPSDGHAFPAWWVMNGISGQIDNNFEQTLYGKIYKYNDATNNTFGSKWDGTTARLDPTNLSTYKYQVPRAFLEFDIVEFMQAQTGYSGGGRSTHNTGKSTGDYRDYIQLTVHKYYDQNVKDNNLYIPDWSTGKVGTAIPYSSFGNTAGSQAFIHRYNDKKVEAPYKKVLSTSWWSGDDTVNSSYSVAEAISKSKLTSGKKTVTDYYTYGFSWTADERTNTYDLWVYVDFNDDGVMAADEYIFHIDETTGHAVTDQTWTAAGTDTDVWNQYGFMLLDNAFYTCNPFGTATSRGANKTTEEGVTQHTDLLSQDTSSTATAGSTDKTTFDIQYVRVYQQNGRRDIVTPETESFNTANHYGYGSKLNGIK